jgi:hypothetical protein
MTSAMSVEPDFRNQLSELDIRRAWGALRSYAKGRKGERNILPVFEALKPFQPIYSSTVPKKMINHTVEDSRRSMLRAVKSASTSSRPNVEILVRAADATTALDPFDREWF